MCLVKGALGDPATKEFLLRRREGFVRLLVRHHVIRVGREDTLDDLGVVGLAGDDGDGAAFAGLQCFRADVQTKLALAGFGVEAVAVKAGVRHDRPNVAIKRDGVIGRGGQMSGGAGGEQEGRQIRAHKGVRRKTCPKPRGFNWKDPGRPFYRASQLTASITTKPSAPSLETMTAAGVSLVKS